MAAAPSNEDEKEQHTRCVRRGRRRGPRSSRREMTPLLVLADSVGVFVRAWGKSEKARRGDETT